MNKNFTYNFKGSLNKNCDYLCGNANILVKDKEIKKKINGWKGAQCKVFNDKCFNIIKKDDTSKCDCKGTDRRT